MFLYFQVQEAHIMLKMK